MTWRALLTGDDADRARAAIAAIVDDLGRLEPQERGLYNGQAGIAILHGALARGGDGQALDRTADALQAASELFAEERAPWLAGGFAGVAFAIAHLSDLIETEADTLDDLDSAIEGILDREAWPFDWELMVGLVGLGAYGLERSHTRAGRAIIERVGLHLAALAERDAGGACWRAAAGATPEQVAAHPDGVYNLGLPYGITGAIAFLAAAGPSELLADSVAWLLARDRPESEDRFPASVGAGWVEEHLVSRGWCSGDLAAGMVLVQAGLAAGTQAWIDRGLAITRHAVGWSSGAGAAAGDLSICHGAIGHAHLYNRIAQATGADDLVEVARACYRRALDARVPGTGIGGFSRIARGPKSANPAFAAGLQLGAAGVALGLLAAISETAPDWDRAFLLALPPAL
jgi:lantibiotic modifying enzyme